jgi:CP family cyanate transporter-like MFS transporter
VILGVLLVASNLRAAITTVGPVLLSIQESLGLPSAAASALVSLPLLAFAIVSPIAPRLALRIGIERSLGLGLAVLAVGLVLRSVPPALLLWVGTALIGVSIAVLNVVLPALVKRDFPHKIGQLTGAYSAVQASFAAIAAGVAVPVAGATALDWRLPLGMWAGLALIALAVLAPQLRRPPKPARPRGPGPGAAAAAGGAGVGGGQRSPWGSALGWQITAYMGLQSLLFYVFITWLPAIEISAGVSEAAAGLHQFLLNAFGILGSLACSALIPRLRDQRLLGVSIPLLLALSMVGVLIAPWGNGVWASVFGFAIGASIVLALSFFGLRTDHHIQSASLSGMAQGIGYALAAAGPILMGLLHDATGTWTPTLIVLIVIGVLLIGLGYLAGRNRTIG